LHEYSNAIEHSKKSVELFPYEANMYNLANAYEWTGNIQESIKYYSLALASKNYISMDHDHFLATYMELSHTLYLAGRYDDAIVIVKRGLGDYPDSGELWKALAMDEYKLGNREKAFSAVTKAKMYLPDDQIDSIYLQIQGK